MSRVSTGQAPRWGLSPRRVLLLLAVLYLGLGISRKMRSGEPPAHLSTSIRHGARRDFGADAIPADLAHTAATDGVQDSDPFAGVQDKLLKGGGQASAGGADLSTVIVAAAHIGEEDPMSETRRANAEIKEMLSRATKRTNDDEEDDGGDSKSAIQAIQAMAAANDVKKEAGGADSQDAGAGGSSGASGTQGGRTGRRIPEVA